jgi:nucleoside-diphosphate-sugar epimerase
LKILVTGAGGFLGRGLIVPFEGKHDLRLMDVVDWPTTHEKVIGSVADLDTCRKALQGCDAMVIAHMASRQAGSYETPELPMDVNVKGTVNLFFAAVELGIKKAVLVSSNAVVGPYEHKEFLERDRLPLRGNGMYGLSKVCQEIIAEQFHREHGISVAALRVGYILSADDPNNVHDKYGKRVTERNAPCIDRRDIGLAAMLALQADGIGYEPFYVLGAAEAWDFYDVQYTVDRLGWRPQYDFSWLRTAPKRQLPVRQR